jgi:hypothetical protein
MKRIWELPGAIIPASRKGQRSPGLRLRPGGSESTPIMAVSASAMLEVASAPSSGSGVRRREIRIATAIAPKSAAETHASRTASNEARLAYAVA